MLTLTSDASSGRFWTLQAQALRAGEVAYSPRRLGKLGLHGLKSMFLDSGEENLPKPFWIMPLEEIRSERRALITNS